MSDADDGLTFSQREQQSTPDREHTAGGNFGTVAFVEGTASTEEFVINNQDTVDHVITFTPRGSQNDAATFTETIPSKVACKYSGRGIRRFAIDSTSSSVTWKRGPRGTVFPLSNPSLGGGALAAASIFVGDQGNYNPSSTGAFLMAGFGASWKITPKRSGKVLLTWYGHYAPNVAGELAVKIAFGTGGAPAQNAAASGTVVGGSQLAEETAGTALLPGCIVVLVTGLTAGTAYWFDLQVEITNAADILHTGGLTAQELVN